MAVFDGVIPAIVGAANAAGAAGYEITRSVRFNSADSAYLSRTPSSTGNTKTWTWSCWVKKAKNGSELFLLRSDVSGGNARDAIRFESTDTLRVFFNGTTGGDLVTNQLFRDSSAWYHIIVAVDTTQATASDRVKIYVNGSQVTSFSTATYPSQNYDTGTFVSGKDATIARDWSGNYLNGYLADVHFIDGQALAATDFGQTDSDNNWNPKAYSGSYGTNGFHLDFSDNSSSAALGTDSSGNSNDWTVNNLSIGTNIGLPTGYTASGFTGILSNIETDDTAYIQAVSSHIDFDLGASYAVGTVTFKFKSYNDTVSANYRIELYSDSGFTNLLANSATSNASSTILTITHDFGSTSARYLRLSYQGGGRVARVYYLSTTGATGFNTFSTDSLIDSPTDYEADSGNNGGNYATLNPLVTNTTTTFANGNLDITSTGQTNAVSSIVPSSGKWYFEITLGSIVTNSFIGLYGTTPLNSSYLTYGINGYGSLNSGWGSPSSTVTGTGVTGDVIGLAFDADAKTLEYYKNGSSIGTISGWTYVENWSIGFSANASISTPWTFNFGQRPFTSTPPTGYLSLCTTNLDDPTIADGSTAFDATLYTGNGSTQTISGLNFSPDLVWAKSRSSTFFHGLIDIVRGVSRWLGSNSTQAEDYSAGNYLTAFNSDGFSVGGGGVFNNSGTTYVAWAWDGGSSTVTNTDGSLTSTVRANPSAGFSIVSVSSDGTDTIRTAGHGLNAVPYFIISKNRDFVDNWFVYHKDIQTDNKQRLNLNTTGAVNSSGSLIWAHTSSVIGFNGAQYVGLGTDDLIFYCFAPVEGFSAFGSYTGNGSADGPFVFTGFRPKFLVVKVYDQADHWVMWDSARGDTNVNNLPLYPNLTNAEAASSNRQVDLLSNGFKLRSIDNSVNGNHNYIYIAFAEHPFKTARAR